MKPLKYNLLKFVAEFLLIIGSIILSFYLQGKIDDQESRKEAIHIMKQIRTDMISDTIKFDVELKNAERLINICNYLLNLDYDKDLINEGDFDTTMFYIGETTTNLYTPIHMAGYTRLVNFPHKEVINDNALIDSSISYYTVDRSKIESYNEVDRYFVDKIMIDQYISNKSYTVLNMYYTRNVLGADYSSNIKQDIITFVETKEIRSLWIFNIINKVNYIKTINYTKESAKRKIESLNQWLEQRQK